MAVVVFHVSVVIAFLSGEDARHVEAATAVRASLERGTERLVCAVTLSEILVGPLRAGRAEIVESLLSRLSIEIRPVDAAIARRGAAVRATTGLALPDAYVVAVGLRAREGGAADVRVESVDRRLLSAYSELAAA